MTGNKTLKEADLCRAIGYAIAERLDKILSPFEKQQAHLIKEVATLKSELMILSAKIDALKGDGDA